MPWGEIESLSTGIMRQAPRFLCSKHSNSDFRLLNRHWLSPEGLRSPPLERRYLADLFEKDAFSFNFGHSNPPICSWSTKANPSAMSKHSLVMMSNRKGRGHVDPPIPAVVTDVLHENQGFCRLIMLSNQRLLRLCARRFFVTTLKLLPARTLGSFIPAASRRSVDSWLGVGICCTFVPSAG
jgi:hypothetical protein